MESPNGKAVLTLKRWTTAAAAIITLATTTTLPALYAAGVHVPAWVPVAMGFLLGVTVIVGQMSGGTRTKRNLKPVGTVPNPVAPEVKP